MKIRFFIFFIGIALIILKIKKLIIIHNGFIALCFFLVLVLYYISVHNKNKEKATPQLVKLVK